MIWHICFFDIDGTLIQDGIIPQSTKTTLKKLKKTDILLLLPQVVPMF